MRPTENWGPSDPVLFADWKTVKNSEKGKNVPVDIESTVTLGYVNQTFKEEVF